MNKTILHTYSADFGNRLKTYLEGKKVFDEEIADRWSEEIF